MALTVTNTNTLSLLNIVNRTSQNQSDVMQRLSTGSRINRGADDPAGLIAMRSLDTELTSVNASITSNQRTDAILGVADKAMGEVTSLLNQISTLAQSSANSAGLSADEVAANQAQVDNAIDSIDRIIRTTEFNGKKLLDGSQGINVTGVNSGNITDVKVYSRRSGTTSATVNVNVATAATRATLDIASAAASSDASISIQGNDGNAVIDINSGDAVSAIAARVNESTGETGVSATVTSGTLTLTSTDYGSAAFVRVTTISGDTTNNFADGNDSGSDAVVTINGQAAAVDGLTVNFSSNGVSASFELTDTYNQAGGADTFTVSDGGATFQLGADSSTRSTLGISGMFSQELGNATLGYLSTLKSGGTNSLINDPSAAANIAKEASSQVAKVQGRIGGFQKFQVQTSLNSANATKQGLVTARSVIADVDYAAETAELNRQNVLLQSSISLLGLANQQSSAILSLLR